MMLRVIQCKGSASLEHASGKLQITGTEFHSTGLLGASAFAAQTQPGSSTWICYLLFLSQNLCNPLRNFPVLSS